MTYLALNFNTMKVRKVVINNYPKPQTTWTEVIAILSGLITIYVWLKG
jgi:hypothetical protein